MKMMYNWQDSHYRTLRIVQIWTFIIWMLERNNKFKKFKDSSTYFTQDTFGYNRDHAQAENKFFYWKNGIISDRKSMLPVNC